MESLEQAARRRLQTQSVQGTRRVLPRLAVDLVDFWSNDYLGLARSVQRATAGSAGSTGSRLLSGNREESEQIECSIARFHGFSSGLIFGSGYDANLGLLSCLARRPDSLVLDGLAHASLIDGAQLSAGRRFRFRHNDVADLQKTLAKVTADRPDGTVIVVVEATYSMDGDHTPLAAIADVCAGYDAGLVVDEAHSVGVVGSQGEGLVASLGLQAEVDACIYTFGKALGCHGALVAGDDWLRDYLVNFCRPFMYSTAPPPTHFDAMSNHHQQMITAGDERKALTQNIQRFNERVAESGVASVRQIDGSHTAERSGLAILASDSPIQSVVVGSNERVEAIERSLQAAGFAVKAIKSPTVSEGSERIRVCLHSFNTEPEIDELVGQIVTAALRSGGI